MRPFFLLAAVFAVGYLLGSLNLSYLVTRYIGKVDIYSVGSGNAGGTNVARAMGLGWGITVIVAEILKSLLFGFLVRDWFPADLLGWEYTGRCLSAAVGVAGCLLGNYFPCFARFRGGKGVSVMGGLMLVYDWRVFLAVIGIFLAVLFLSRMVSVASLTCAVAIPILVGIRFAGTQGGWILTGLTAAMCLSVMIRHRGNIVRIFRGEERKIRLGKKSGK